MSTAPFGNGSAGLDMAAIRAAIGTDEQVANRLATVVEVPVLNEDGDWDVEVRTHHHEAPITASLGGAWGGDNIGLWHGIEVGRECLLAFPDSNYEATPIVVLFLPSTGNGGAVPPEMLDVTQLRSDRVLVVSSGDIQIVTVGGGKVSIQQRGGSPAPLATLADVQDVRNDLHSHEHTYIPGPGPGVTVTTLGPSVTNPTGTQILEAE